LKNSAQVFSNKMRIATLIFGCAFLAIFLIGGSEAAECTDAELQLPVGDPGRNGCTDCTDTANGAHPDCTTTTEEITTTTELTTTTAAAASSPSDSSSSNAATQAELTRVRLLLVRCRNRNLNLQRRITTLNNIRAAEARRAALFPRRNIGANVNRNPVRVRRVQNRRNVRVIVG